ncbi:MAG: hypothetical protein Q7S28_00415 [bacterium]|nr:hypothetical protein [bacterium]
MKVSTLFRRGEKFLVLEVGGEHTRGVLLAVNREKHVRPKKVWDDFSWQKLLRTDERLNVGGFFLNLKKTPVIVSVDSGSASTTLVPLSLRRKKSDGPLIPEELEHFLTLSLERKFNELRKDASAKLSVDELDAVLISTRVLGVSVDGRDTVNPIGIASQKIEMLLELVFSSRHAFDIVNAVAANGGKFFVTESGKSALACIAKAHGTERDTAVFDDATRRMFQWSSDRVPPLRRTDMAWTSKQFVSNLCEAWSLSEHAGNSLYHRYLAGDISEKAAKFFDRVLTPHADALFQELSRRGARGVVYLASARALPYDFPVRKQGMTVHRLPYEQVIASLGFSIDTEEWQTPLKETFQYTLAPFFEFYYDNSDMHLTRWLHRRIHWLAP